MAVSNPVITEEGGREGREGGEGGREGRERGEGDEGGAVEGESKQIQKHYSKLLRHHTFVMAISISSTEVVMPGFQTEEGEGGRPESFSLQQNSPPPPRKVSAPLNIVPPPPSSPRLVFPIPQQVFFNTPQQPSEFQYMTSIRRKFFTPPPPNKKSNMKPVC